MAKHFSPVNWVLASTLISVTGEWILTLIVPWFVIASTGSTSLAGLVLFAELAPAVVVRFMAGPVVGRVGRRLTSWLTGVVQAVCVAMVAVLVAADALAFPVLLALMALMGAAGGAGVLAKGGLAPAAAKFVGLRQGFAISMSGAMIAGGQVVGPALGGPLVHIPVVGLVAVAVLFAVASLIIGRLPRGMESARVQVVHAKDKPGYWKSLGEQIHHFRKDRLLVKLFAMLFTMEFLVAPMNGVFLPQWARETGAGAGTIATLASSAAFAGLVGNFVAVYVTQRVRPYVLMSVGYALIVPQLLVLALGAPVWLVNVVWVVAGFAGAFPFAVVGQISQLRPPEEFRDQTRAVGGAITRSGSALGAPVLGSAVQYLGLTGTLLGAAAMYFAMTQGTVHGKDIRALEPGISREDLPGASTPEKERVG
ncbi:MFS transporter [Streptomyces sp. NPDC048636]|uniref:MFS transporter n=1 Tax=Streptomyces sp. NPDC048636 TaxID=3155762 RepID=UPI003440B57B